MSDAAPRVDLEFSLAGKVAIVTGGGSGIGAAIATAFAAKGASVAIFDIALAGAEARAAEIGGAARAFACDVSDAASVQTAVTAAHDAFGRIDILVNSAGIVALAPAESLSIDAFDRTIAINLKGTFLVSQAVGRLMIAAGGGGRIVNLASQAGTVAIEEHAAYCASKFGVIGLTKTLAAEWGRHGIRANTLSPTIVLTDLGRAAWAGEKGEAARKRIPAGRFDYPEDIAAAAVFLASSGAEMINGADLLIDGGYTLL